MIKEFYKVGSGVHERSKNEHTSGFYEE